MSDRHEERARGQKSQLKTVQDEIKKQKEDISELKTSADDFDSEIESSQAKQRMIQDQMESLKHHIDELENNISLKVLTLKELKEKKDEVEQDNVNIE